jgi:endonuclease G, mitochondrial
MPRRAAQSNVSTPADMQLEFAEHDTERLGRRISHVTQASAETVQAIVSGDAEAAMTLDPRGRSKIAELLTQSSFDAFESRVGPDLEFQDVVNLELARAAASSVARVLKNGEWEGSGFLVGQGLFLTNAHVFSDPERADRFEIEFNFELDDTDQPRPTTRFALDAQSLFLSSPKTHLDYTLVAVGQRVSGSASLESFGYCPLLAQGDKHAMNNFANVIQHPDGNPKQIAIRENRITGRGPKFTLFYGADTLRGSSGSPVFNDEYEVIALHHAGAPSLEKTFEDGQPVPVDTSNEGIRASVIHADLTNRLMNLSAPERTLLEPALQSEFRGPSLMRNPARTEEHDQSEQAITTANEGKGDRMASDENVHTEVKPLALPAGTSAQIVLPKVQLTLPIELRVVSSGATDFALDLQAEDDLERRRRPGSRPDPDYSNRRGYFEGFLGESVALPQPSDTLQAQLAQNRRPSNQRPTHVLDYQYFSLAIHRERKIAVFTAINIDDADRFPVERRGDTWSSDPRIGADEQTNEALYANNDLDRGHIVRRADTNWGSEQSAVRANFDTFHFTNCSPQHAAFNQSERNGLWGMLENYVTEKAMGRKISVFGGAILNAEDPEYRGAQLPREFWKILVRVDHEGRSAASAFVLSQAKLLQTVFEGRSLSEQQAELFQHSIEDLQNMTDLKFDDLLQADTKRLESRGAHQVTRLTQIEL